MNERRGRISGEIGILLVIIWRMIKIDRCGERGREEWWGDGYRAGRGSRDYFFFWNSSDNLIVVVYCYGLKIYRCIYRSIQRSFKVRVGNRNYNFFAQGVCLYKSVRAARSFCKHE
jgi:hypothetical protein